VRCGEVSLGGETIRMLRKKLEKNGNILPLAAI
jgi:hypothetical protein